MLRALALPLTLLAFQTPATTYSYLVGQATGECTDGRKCVAQRNAPDVPAERFNFAT